MKNKNWLESRFFDRIKVMKTGVATVPLDYGKCPLWLFERMKKLSQGIVLAIVEEFGTDELLKRLSDPVWFQSFGCVLAFDWNSSGLTTTVTGALKEGVRGMEDDLGLFICGGKGKTSKKTPDQIQEWGEFLHLSLEEIDKIIYASKMGAKVDNTALQDGFQLYHHNFIFSKSGQWMIIQQGMNSDIKKARRYHWLSTNIQNKSGRKDFIEEPHSGIASQVKVKPLNLTAKESEKNRNISVGILKEEPNAFLKNIELISKKSNHLIKQKRLPGFAEMELNNVEFHEHPIMGERFNLKRLEKIIFLARDQEPQDFEQLLAIKGVGPKTIRALSLVSELVYGAKPSYEDPARYSFAHGGKDGTPYFPKPEDMDLTIEVLEKGIKKSRASIKEKAEAQKRLHNLKS